MNFPKALFVTALVLCSCRKPADPIASAGATRGDAGSILGVASALTDDAGATLAADSGAGDQGTRSPHCHERIALDGGSLDDLTDFIGFSSDGRRFAFSVHSEGAGAVVLTVIETGNTLVKKFLLDTTEAKRDAKAFLAEGGYTRERLRASFPVDVASGAARVTTSGGTVVYGGTPFGGTTGHNLRAVPWGCDSTGTRAALEVTQQFENEYGNARAFVIFDTAGEAR